MSSKNHLVKVGRKLFFRRAVLVFIISVIIFSIIALISFLSVFLTNMAREKGVVTKLRDQTVPEWVDVQIIGEDCGGRSGRPLEALRNIVVHYVGNPSTSAQNNHDYFNKTSTQVCSHFIIGLQGEIIQCLPLYEQSVASNWRNKDTISIEVCHPDESGKFNDSTYNSLVKLTAWLCYSFFLDEKDIIRHHDVTGKLCPLYFVENENEWEEFKIQVGKNIDEY